MSGNLVDSLVIIPTYNEIENIEPIIEAVLSVGKNFHVLVIDDNSPDGTGKKVRTLQEAYPERLFLEVRKGKLGLGTAYIHGFKWAIKREYDYIFEMDADFSHNPKDLLRLYKACRSKAHVAVGSRYKKGIHVVNWPLHRIVLSYGASLYVRLITRMQVRDATSGFIGYRRAVLERIDLDAVRFTGYAFQIEMKFKAHNNRFTIEEIPIVFTDRVRGKSKMNSAIILEAIFGVISMKIRSLLHNPKD